MKRPDEQPWITRTNTVVYDNPWIQVSHRDVFTPTGSEGIYGVVSFKNHGVGIVPIDDDDHTWLVGQYRYVTDSYEWEIPAGGAPIDDDPIETAHRELREEVGLVAERIDFLQAAQLSNSVTDELALLYVATGLTPVEVDPEPTEVFAIRRLPLREAVNLVRDGTIVDSLSVMALLRLAIERGIAP